MLVEDDSRDILRYPVSTASHLRPVPLVPEGRILASEKRVRGLMDVSDGLVRDLSRFLASGTGVEISRSFSVHQEVVLYCASIRTDPIIFSLLGGEDYSLLGGCSQDDWPVIQSSLAKVWKLGRVISGQGIFLDGHKLSLKGFDHFEK
jgi:thiamine-monophosphate kinase